MNINSKYFFLLFLFFFIKNNLDAMKGAFHLDKMIASSVSQADNALSLEIIESLFSPRSPQFKEAIVLTDIDALHAVARDALDAINRCQRVCKWPANTSSLSRFIDEEKTRKTLQFIVTVIERDREAQRAYRFKNPDFLKKHFHYLRWKSDNISAKKSQVRCSDDSMIRLTHYVIFEAAARRTQDSEFCCGLYQLLDHSIASKYNKQEVIAGALQAPENRKKVRPLAWVTRESFEHALLQGTLFVKFPDGSQDLLNINVSNGMAYNALLEDRYQQKRYWYFLRIKNAKFFIQKLQSRVAVLLAGDLNSLGFGRVIVLESINRAKKQNELRIGILADTGAAFTKNAYQLDMFAGIFPDIGAVKAYVKTQPMYARAHVAYRSA